MTFLETKNYYGDIGEKIIISNAPGEWKVRTPPKQVGEYAYGPTINRTVIPLTFKPSRWHRFWMKFFFGFEWRSYEKQ